MGMTLEETIAAAKAAKMSYGQYVNTLPKEDTSQKKPEKKAKASCRQCGGAIEGRQKVFCSKACRDKYWWWHKKKVRPDSPK